MDGKCFSCASKFGFFKREYGCNKCGHSYCKNCLPYEAVIPSRGSTPLAVCKKCFKLLTQQPDEKTDNKLNEAKYSPPENFKKRVAALQEREAGGQDSKRQTYGSPKPNQKQRHKNLEPKDVQLAERLEKLKQNDKKPGKPMTTVEIEKRLRALKDLPDKSENGQTTFTADRRTGYEQTQDLLSQVTEEVNIDNKFSGASATPDEEARLSEPNQHVQTLEDETAALIENAKADLKRESERSKKDDEFQARLAKLQGMDLQTYKDKGREDLMNMSEEEATRRYIAKLLEEDRLDAKVSQDGHSDLLDNTAAKSSRMETPVDSDELPWCSICNEDASLRCHGCEDLYCKRCFKECHDKYDLEDHVTSSYRPPKNKGR